jgi:glycosyltransferase involved in cell wall biosynthesis
MVVPSLQENLSNAIMESLSCAIPVVGFNIGGNSDMIEHKKTGYLAKPFNPQDLANGIEWVLESEAVIVDSDSDRVDSGSRYEWLCKNAREKVLREFDSRAVAKKYIELYEEVLSRSVRI